MIDEDERITRDLLAVVNVSKNTRRRLIKFARNGQATPEFLAWLSSRPDIMVVLDRILDETIISEVLRIGLSHDPG